MAEEQKQEQKIIAFSQTISSQTEVTKFLEETKKNLPNKISPMTSSEFFDYVDESNNNLERIWAQYDAEEKKKYESDYNNKNLPYIKAGTTVLIPENKIEVEILKMTSQGQFLSQKDFKTYWSENLEKINKSIKYAPETNEITEGTYSLQIIPQSVRVWIYVKALDKIIDVSQFVYSCSTNKQDIVGAFNLTLSPIKDLENINAYNNGYFQNFNITDTDGIRTKDIFEKFVTFNDLVFIRFEKLQIEKDAMSGKETDDLEVPTNMLVNKGDNYNVWDMIGFIDTCDVSTSSIVNDSLIQISGRDFSKLFIEDGSYFIPIKYVEGSKDHWFYGGEETDSWFRRNVLSGNYNYLFTYGYRGIKESMWFILNVLSNIGIVKDDLFASYQDRRTEAYTLEDDGGESKKQKVEGIWQIVKVFVEDNLNNRVVVDTSFANPSGTMMSYINKVCQEPFVEVIFDTYLDTLDIVVRQPPFTKAAIEDVISSKNYTTISTGALRDSILSYDERVYGWYQIFPQDNQVGTKQAVSQAFVPIIYFDEIIKAFGNSKLQVVDIYANLCSLYGASGIGNLNGMAATLLNDLLFVIETNIYLPFTRKGTLTVTGDRRIKVGTFVLNEATEELFYVTGVSQSVSFATGEVERTTTIQVERGMFFPILAKKLEKESYIDNIKTDGGKVASYFEIAKLEEMKKDISKAEKSVEDNQNNFGSGKNGLDVDQFNFFLKRKMFKGNKVGL